MTSAQYLKAQLNDFVDSYKKFSYKTNGITIVLTLVAFAATALLLNSGYIDPAFARKQTSLLNFFFRRYSFGRTYSIIDLTKPCFLFLVSLFSIALTRVTRSNNDLSFNDLMSQLKAKDIGCLAISLCFCSIADYFLFKLSTPYDNYDINFSAKKWIYQSIYFVRIYIPLLSFSFANFFALSNEKMKLTTKKILLLLFTLWLINEFAFDVYLFLRDELFQPILILFPEERYYIVETILGVPLISFYFLGYHSAMTSSMLLLNGNLKDAMPEMDLDNIAE